MRDILVALIVFGSIPFILTRPYLGLLMWSWLGYMNPYRLAYGFAYSFPWVEIIAVVTIGSLLFSKENKKIPMCSVSILLFLFFVWTIITTLFAVEAHAWLRAGEFWKTLVMVAVTLILVNSRRRMHWLVWVIVVSIGFYGVKGGIFTVLKGGDYRVLGPPQSFIGDNNTIALALCMVLPLMRYLQMHSTYKLVRVGLGFSMVITGIAVLGTYSRGGLIALGVVSAYMLLKARRRLMISLAIILLGLVAYRFMPTQWVGRMQTLSHAEQTESAQTRIQSWEFAWNVALHRPLVGGGIDAYESDTMWKQYGPRGAISRAVHSVYFRVLSEQGFLGLILFVGLLFLSWKNCSRVRKKTRGSVDQRWAYDLATMLEVSLVAYMAAGAFLPMSYFDLTYQLMALCALLAGYSVQHSENGVLAESQQKGVAPLTQQTRSHDLLQR